MHAQSPRSGGTTHGPPSIASFTGFAIEEEDTAPDPDDWFANME